MESGYSKQILIFFVLLAAIDPNKNSTTATTDLVPKATTQFIKASCTATTYPKLCFTSLSAHANKIQTNPELLTKTAIDVALLSTETTSSTVANLLKSKGQLSRREVGAVTDCVEELRDSMDRLKRSVSEMKKLKGGDGFDFEMTMSNIQTWISAALTDEDACMEGFGGRSMDGYVKAFVKQHIEMIAHLTSNALALVNKFADLHG
ncbi:hypothetical protein SDJN03_03023, partial [Cucurbita argyrosperma subsp. sororia]